MILIYPDLSDVEGYFNNVHLIINVALCIEKMWNVN